MTSSHTPDTQPIHLAPQTTHQATASSAPSPQRSQGGDSLRNYQRAYLLQQVLEAPNHQLTKGKANRFPRAVGRELDLAPAVANTLRDELVQEGYLRTLKKSGSIVYELTESGKALLQNLEQKPIPEGRRPTREGPVSAEVQLARKTFLLFQLFEAEGQVLDQKAANRFREPGRKFLELKGTTANRLRKEMADQGLIHLTRHGRNSTYRLTQAGIEFLGARSSFPATEFSLNGRVLNDLLEIARETARQFQPTTSETSSIPQDVPQPVGQMR